MGRGSARVYTTVPLVTLVSFTLTLGVVSSRPSARHRRRSPLHITPLHFLSNVTQGEPQQTIVWLCAGCYCTQLFWLRTQGTSHYPVHPTRDVLEVVSPRTEEGLHSQSYVPLSLIPANELGLMVVLSPALHDVLAPDCQDPFG